MVKITASIYGYGDDCIDVDFDPDPFHNSEEFNLYDKPGYLRFSEGTVLRVQYGPDDACWHIRRVREGTAKGVLVWNGSEDKEDEQVPGHEDVDGYSDLYELTGEDLKLMWFADGDDIPEERDLSTPERRLAEFDALIRLAEGVDTGDGDSRELVIRMKELWIAATSPKPKRDGI